MGAGAGGDYLELPQALGAGKKQVGLQMQGANPSQSAESTNYSQKVGSSGKSPG